MAWRYCDICDGELGYPTDSEAIKKEQECPHCGEFMLVSEEESVAALLDMLGRIEALERTMALRGN